MTPSAAPRSSHRARLLVGSALWGLAALLAQPALAQTLPAIPGAGGVAVSSGGGQPVITAPNANTLDIDLNAPRTVINWASLHVSGADTMTFHFDANSDIVLNKTTTAIAVDAGGTVSGKVGAATGGNIWFYSPQGVFIAPGANMTAGGFLFSQGTGLSDAAFVNAADPLANLRAAADSLVRVATITSATTVSISAGGDVLLSAASGDLNANVVAAAESATMMATTGSVSVSEVTATGGNVTVTALGGGADVASASAGGDITVIATSGDAILHAASLTGTGVGHDLSVSATGGAAVLGELDYQDITAANVFSRAGGNGGTASVTSIGGDALVHLDASADLTTVRGEGVDITVQTGPLTVETLTALANDAYGETYDGAITVGAAAADHGHLELYAAGGDLTVTGSAHGGDLVRLQTDGLLDVSGATLISSDGDLELVGDAVKAGEVSAIDSVTVAAVNGAALVEKAVAGATVQVGSLYGSATLRAAEGADGIAVFADQTATFGADTRAGITAAHYAITDAACGCGPGSGGLQVLSSSGDAVVNINATNAPIALVAAALDGDATVVLKTGDLSIDELAAFNIRLEAMDGTVETGFATSGGGDYWVKGHDFLGDVLTPTLFTGGIRDVTIIDTLGNLALTGDLYAGRKLTIAAEDGAVTGDAALLAGAGAGDGDVSVTASAIALDTVEGDGEVILDADVGAVTVATRVTVGKTYRLTGGAFSTAALSPLGAQTGFWSITDNAGDFDHAGVDLAYVGGIAIRAATGALKVRDITSATGDLYLEGDSGVIGALRAETGVIDARGYVGSLAVTSATALDDIDLYGQTGVTLGALDLKGLGTNTFEIHSGGDIVLGAATPGAITAANAATSASAFSGSVMETTLGAIHINLDHATAQFSNVTALGAVAIDVRHGALSVVSAVSFGAGVGIDGPDGALTVQTLAAHGGDAHVSAGDVALRGAAVDGDLVVTATTGDITLENLVRADTLSLQAAHGVSQAAGAVIDAPLLTVTAGSGASLLGANKVTTLGAVDVTTGGFAFNAVGALDLTDTIDAAGQVVDLRAGGAIAQTGGVITAGTLTGRSVGGASFGRDNQVPQLGAFTNTGGGLLFNDASALTLTGAVLSTGTLVIRSHGGLTLAATGGARADGMGDAVVLASDGVFTNASGADGVVASNPAGRWLVYSQAVGDPAGSTAGDSFGGLAGKSFYGAAYDFATGAFGVAPNAGNRFVHAYQPTLTATPVSRTVTYDGTIPTVSATLSGLVNGDSAADAWSGQAAVAGATSKAARAYSLTASIGSLASDLNYAFAFGTGLLTIDPKAITGQLLASDKTYDGTATAAGTVLLTGVVLGDTVGASGAYSFADKTAGLGKTVTASGVALAGADAGNYVLSSVAADSADIARRTITGAVVATGKTYDGRAAASGSTSLAGVVAGDDLSVTGAYAFADKNAGVGKVVTITGAALVGGDAGNYDLASVTAGRADIGRKTITGAAVADSKTYDGTTAATGAISLEGVVAGDQVSATATFAFADKEAGSAKTVAVSGAALAGADQANYDLGGVGAALADILRRAVTVAADAGGKPFGQRDPVLTYHLAAGQLVQGEGFTGHVARQAGEAPGPYAIGRGSLALSANYDVTFTGAVFTIRPTPATGQDGGPALRALAEAIGFDLDWPPDPDLSATGALGCLPTADCPRADAWVEAAPRAP